MRRSKDLQTDRMAEENQEPALADDLCLDTEDTVGPGSAQEETFFLVEEKDTGSRLDAFLARQLPDRTRSYLSKLISQGLVGVGGTADSGKPVTKAGFKVKAGQAVSVQLPQPEPLVALPEPIPLDILYEDEDLIVVNKPKGMVVHPAAGHFTGTLVNALLFHCQGSLSGIGGVMRPGIVHRIDKDTTGALLAAKNDKAHNCFADQLRLHSMTRRYRAIVLGNLKEDQGTVDAPIARHPTDRKKMAVCLPDRGREAVTHYRVLERFGTYTYVECKLDTGRTHQIRVHMAHIGHPLLGDSVYGPSKCPYNLEGQTLHAMVLGFRHPATGAYMEFTAPLPEYFEDLLERFRRKDRAFKKEGD